MFNGKRLKELRLQKGLTQSQLGDLLNVTKVSVCCYEKQTRTPSIETLDDLTNVFGVDANYFLGKDIAVVTEETEEYVIYLSKEEVKLIKELRQHKKMYNMIVEEPKRMVELIDKKLN